MLISDIIAEVISEVGGDVQDTDLIAKMLIFAKGTLRRFPLFTKSRLLKITSYATLAGGVNYLTTPTYFIDESMVWYEESGRKHIIIRKNEDEFAGIVNTSISGAPEFYHITGNVIEFDKNADTDRIIYVEHSGEVDDITAASSFFGPTDMLEILKDGIKSTYYGEYVEDSSGKGDKALMRFKAGLDKLEERAMIQNCGGYIGE